MKTSKMTQLQNIKTPNAANTAHAHVSDRLPVQRKRSYGTFKHLAGKSHKHTM